LKSQPPTPQAGHGDADAAVCVVILIDLAKAAAAAVSVDDRAKLLASLAPYFTSTASDRVSGGTVAPAENYAGGPRLETRKTLFTAESPELAAHVSIVPALEAEALA
jgi:hypothetical protein